jgi:hypothetical protein
LWSRHQAIKVLFRIKCGGFRASFLHLMWDCCLVGRHFNFWLDYLGGIL